MKNLNYNSIKDQIEKLSFTKTAQYKHNKETEFNLIRNEFKFNIDTTLCSILSLIESGYFIESVFFKSISKVPIFPDNKKCDITKFYSLDSSHSDSFYKIKINNEDLVNKSWLPFAEATPGDHLCISFDPLDSGAVYFISHEEDNGFYKVSNSFNAFISSLYIGVEEASDSSGFVSEWFADDF